MRADVRRNAFLLAGSLVCNSGAFQLAAALSSLTLVAVTGVKGILGLGPAIFLAAGAIAVGPAGRLMDRTGRMPVIRGGFVLGAIGCGTVAGGCSAVSAFLVCLGLALVGAAGAIVLLARAAAAEMFPPDRRARGMSFVLFGAVSGAIWGPVVFGPLFAHRTIDAGGLVGPWLLGIPFMVAGFIVTSFVRPDPKEIAASYPAERDDTGGAAPLREILRRPGVVTAVVAVVASFSVMASVMNLAGYIAVGRGHNEGDVFTMISVHILGMYGLVLVVGGSDRPLRPAACARRRASSLMAVSNAALVWLGGRGRDERRPARSRARLERLLRRRHDRARLADRPRPSVAASSASPTSARASSRPGSPSLGGLVYSGAGVTALALSAAALAAVPAVWLAAPAEDGRRLLRFRYNPASADALSASFL